VGTSTPVQRLVTGEYKHPFILQLSRLGSYLRYPRCKCRFVITAVVVIGTTGETIGGGGTRTGTGAGARAGACVAVADVADDGVRRHGIFVVRSESFVRQWHGHRPFVA
jgi:hypothetical protein